MRKDQARIADHPVRFAKQVRAGTCLSGLETELDSHTVTRLNGGGGGGGREEAVKNRSAHSTYTIVYDMAQGIYGNVKKLNVLRLVAF